MSLYHRDIVIPAPIKSRICGHRLTLRYSQHSLREILGDRYAPGIDIFACPPPRMVEVNEANLVEVETLAGTFMVSKVVVRIPYNVDLDLVLAVTMEGLVKTMWFNLRSDTHVTLDASKYEKA